jgi:hypothetical protein
MYIETSSGKLRDEAELRSNVTFDGKVIQICKWKGSYRSTVFVSSLLWIYNYVCNQCL